MSTGTVWSLHLVAIILLSAVRYATKMRHPVFFISILSMAIVMGFCVKMNVNYEWRYLDFVWSPEEKQQAIDSGNYNASACGLHDVDKAPGTLVGSTDIAVTDLRQI